MVATELILGMGEMVNYIRELEEKNKKLEEEKKKLKEDLEKAWDQRGDKWRKARNKKLEEENKQLKEEVEVLRKGNETYEDLLAGEDGLIDKNKELKEPMVEELEDYLEMNGAEGGVARSQGERDFYKKKVVELKEENKKLKEKQEYFRVRNCDRMEELVKALSPWKKNHSDHKRILEAIGELKEENKKLKEENKKLKEGDKHADNYWRCIMDHLSNPDNPDVNFIKLWASEDGLNEEDTEELLNNFGCYDDSDEEDEEKCEEEYQPKGSRIDPEGLHDYMKEEIDKLKQQLEAFESLTGIGRDVVCRHNDPDDDDYYTYKTFEEYEEEIGEMDEDESDED